MKVLMFVVALPVSVVMEGGLLADDYGWHMRSVCSKFQSIPVSPEGMCHKMVLEKFRAMFPGTTLPLDDCVRKAEAEAMMWGAVYDRGWADRYYARVVDLCGGEASK